MSIKAVISDVSLSHATSVKAALLSEAAGSILENEIAIRYGGVSADLEYAVSQGATILVRSTTGAPEIAAVAGRYYRDHGIQVFVPAGSNTEGIEVYESFGGTKLPVIVLTGAGDLDNETADDIEFFAPDVVTVEPDYSSYSNPYVAAQVYRIKVALDCSWWEARYRARVTASNAGVWDETDGFGLIDVAAAIAWTGTVPADPYQLVGVVGSISLHSQFLGNIILQAAAVDNADEYVFNYDEGAGYINEIVQSSRSFSLTLQENVETSFIYKARNSFGDSSASTPYTTTYVPAPPPPGPVPSPAPVIHQWASRASIGARKFA